MGRRRTHLHRGATVVEPQPLTEELKRQLDIERNNVEFLTQELVESAGSDLSESLTDLERALYEPGWQRFSVLTEREFAPDTLVQLRQICRLMSVANPLIKRGAQLRSAYVWGQGVEITARANGQDKAPKAPPIDPFAQPGMPPQQREPAVSEQDVQAVISAFLDDPGNKRAVTGDAARDRLERCLYTDGELFLAFTIRPTTGDVQVRTVIADEIVDVIYNPDDRSEPWYYRRRWIRRQVDKDGRPAEQQMERLYPCLDYRPRRRPRRIGQTDVDWNMMLLHVDVNRPESWSRGVPDCYAAIAWARAYKEFLENWAVLMRALSRYAWRLTAKGAAKAQAKTRIAAAPARDPVTGGAQDVGGTAITPPDATFEAIPKSGATIDAESGRPLAMMVASAIGVPVTMLLADPGQTGARATAETLDLPTELEMTQRRNVWGGVYHRMCDLVIAESVKAPKGSLKGSVKVDDYGVETVVLRGDTPTTVDIVWPDLDDYDPATRIKAIVEAHGTDVLPDEHIARLLLTVLGVRDVDEILAEMVGPTGQFQRPGQLGALSVGPGAAPGVPGADPAAGAGPIAVDDDELATGDPYRDLLDDIDYGLFGDS